MSWGRQHALAQLLLLIPLQGLRKPQEVGTPQTAITTGTTNISHSLRHFRTYTQKRVNKHWTSIDFGGASLRCFTVLRSKPKNWCCYVWVDTDHCQRLTGSCRKQHPRSEKFPVRDQEETQGGQPIDNFCASWGHTLKGELQKLLFGKDGQDKDLIVETRKIKKVYRCIVALMFWTHFLKFKLFAFHF